MSDEMTDPTVPDVAAPVVVEAVPDVPAVVEPVAGPVAVPAVEEAAPDVEVVLAAARSGPPTDAEIMEAAHPGSTFTKTVDGWSVVIRDGGTRLAGEGETIATAAQRARA
jgi:hypothetical protein